MGRVGGQLQQVGGDHPGRETRRGLKGRQGAVRAIAGRITRGHIGAGGGAGQVAKHGAPVRGRGGRGQELEERDRVGLALP